MSLRRSYTDGPNESQKLYGSDLPPSLRWGSARKITGTRGPDAASRPEVHSNFPQIPSYAESDSHRAKIGAAAVGGLAASAIRRPRRSHSHGNIGRQATDLAEGRTDLRLERRMRSRSRGRRDTGSSDSKGRGHSGYSRHELARLERDIPAPQDVEPFERKRRPYAIESSVKAGAEEFDNSSPDNGVEYRQRHSRRPEPIFHRRRSRRQAADVPGSTESRSPRRSRSKSMRSDSSKESYPTWAPRASILWFSKSWSVRSAEGLHMKPHGLGQTSPVSPNIVTELSCDPLPQVGFAPSAFQRVRSRRYNHIFPTIEPTLKRVIHATYGDLLQNEALKGPDQPGFIAVPQSCSSQGDTLYHILWVIFAQD